VAKKDIISQSLGLSPIIDQESSSKIVDVLPVIKAEKNNDYEYARRNLYDVIEKGSNALEDIMDIAKQSESPRAFEVVTNLIKTMVDANKDLLELAKKQKELNKEDDTGPSTVNNNLFVGSSAELLKMIKQESEK
jgi:hypothetical protein